MENVIYKGTELKLNINIEPIGGISMDEYDFTCEFYCSMMDSIVISKSDMHREDANNYVALLNSDRVSTGSLKCKITAYIPDADFDDGLRTEVQLLNTGITIKKWY